MKACSKYNDFGFKPQLHSHDSGHDSSRFETDGKIGVHRDASGRNKKENPASIRGLMMILLCLHDSSTDPLPFTTVELRMLMISSQFDTVLVQFKPVASQPPTNVHD